MFKNKKLNVFTYVLVVISRLALFVYCILGIIGAVEHRSILGVIVATVLAVYYLYGLCKDLLRIQENYRCVGSKKDLLKFKYNETGYNHCYGCLYCYWKTEKDKEN